jgi:hypothetical protein
MGFWAKLRRLDLEVEVALDRGQWMCDLSVDGAKPIGFHVFITAIDGEQSVTIHDESPPARMHPQFPVGVAWAVELPRVIEWLAASDRESEVLRAKRLWRDASMAWWKRREKPGRR